jgi:hypothetical protein
MACPMNARDPLAYTPGPIEEMFQNNRDLGIATGKAT